MRLRSPKLPELNGDEIEIYCALPPPLLGRDGELKFLNGEEDGGKGVNEADRYRESSEHVFFDPV